MFATLCMHADSVNPRNLHSHFFPSSTDVVLFESSVDIETVESILYIRNLLMNHSQHMPGTCRVSRVQSPIKALYISRLQRPFMRFNGSCHSSWKIEFYSKSFVIQAISLSFFLMCQHFQSSTSTRQFAVLRKYTLPITCTRNSVYNAASLSHNLLGRLFPTEMTTSPLSLVFLETVYHLMPQRSLSLSDSETKPSFQS